MLTTGTVTSPIGHTRGVPLPGPRPIRPVQRRNTSPFTTTAPAQPDPDAIARLERLGYVTVQAVVVDEKPMKVVTRAKGKRKSAPGRRTPGATPLRRTDLDPKKLAEEYRAGATLAELAAKYHTTHPTLLNRLRSQNVEMRPMAPRAIVPTERIVELYEKGLSNKEIAAEVGLSDITVGNRLRSRGIVGGRGHFAVFDEDLAIALAHDGLSAYAIGKAVGVCRRSVIGRLAQLGVTFEDARHSTDIDRLLALGREGKTITQIADELEVSERTVSTHLHKAGIVPPDGRRSNANAPRPDITPELLATDYRAGFTIHEIAAKHHVSRATVRRRLAAVPDLPNHRGGQNRTSAEVQADIVREYAAGLNAKEVAQRLDLPHQTVYGVLRRSGVEMRPAGVAHRGRPGVDGASGLKELMRSNGITAADVRAWAIATGREITARGLPSRVLLEDYLLHHRRNHEERHTA